MPPRAAAVSQDEQQQLAPRALRKRKVDPLLGATLAGKYKIIDKLGEGGMGTVYRATQMPIDRLVAVKVLLGKLAEDEVAVRRFEQEARAVSKMQHPNTVTIYDYGQTEDGRLYLVMEFLKGRTLTDLLRADGPLDGKRVIKIIREVCASLADAHAAGIIHRDLKPDNIFLTEVGGDADFAKVLDFGVAKLADNEAAATLTQTGMIFGTPKYMSPEQAEGKPIDFRADIYAIGVVMYELLTGRPPFLADTAVALLLKHISEPAPDFAKIRPDLHVHPHLEAVTMKALAKNPDNRYLMVTDLSHDLTQILGHITTGPIPAASTTTEPRQAAMSSALPTEVVPGQLGRPDISSGELLSPQAVPDGLSLGVPAAGGLRQPHVGATQPADAAAILAASPTAAQPRAQGPLQSATLTEPEVMPAAGTTQPIAGQGPQIETLGGVMGLDTSQPLRPPRRSNNGLLVGLGVVALVGAVLAVVLSGGEDSTVTSSPIEKPVVEKPEVEELVAEKPEVEEPATDDGKDPVAASPEPRSPRSNTRRTPRPTPQEAPVEVTPPAPPPESLKVTFKFESSPAGALVVLDGAQIGRTPFTREFPKGIDVVSFVFSADGFKADKVIASLSNDRTVQASLQKAAAEPAVTTPKPPKPATSKTKPPTTPPKKDVLNERVDDLKDL